MNNIKTNERDKMKPFLIVSFLIVAASMLESRVNGQTQYCTAEASTIDSSNNRHLILIIILKNYHFSIDNKTKARCRNYQISFKFASKLNRPERRVFETLISTMMDLRSELSFESPKAMS